MTAKCKHLTPTEVRAKVAEIQAFVDQHHDYEKAQMMETNLIEDVLRAIAEGAHGWRQLATEALKVLEIDYPRGWGG